MSKQHSPRFRLGLFDGGLAIAVVAAVLIYTAIALPNHYRRCTSLFPHASAVQHEVCAEMLARGMDTDEIAQDLRTIPLEELQHRYWPE